jgi:hypothetical protein
MNEEKKEKGRKEGLKKEKILFHYHSISLEDSSSYSLVCILPPALFLMDRVVWV